MKEKKFNKMLIVILFATLMILFRTVNKVEAASASTLSITGQSLPTTVNVGAYFDCKGKISSNYTITSVTGTIYSLDLSKAYYTKTVNPNAKTYSLYGGKIDCALLFNKMNTGTYIYRISAKDSSGTSKTLVNQQFNVGTPYSLLKITGQTEPTNVALGAYFDCKGVISSNYNITNVTGGIYSSDLSKTYYTKSIAPNRLSYNLFGSAIDGSLLFNKLQAGTYVYRITATDASGKYIIAINKSFTVGNGGTTNNPSENPVINNGTQKFTVVYNANGGSGSMSNTIVPYGITTPIRKNIFKKTNYAFRGWNVQRAYDGKWIYTNGKKTGWYTAGKQPSKWYKEIYKDGQKISKTTDVSNDIVTFYATWSKMSNTIIFNKSMISKDGWQKSGTIYCMAYSLAYCKTILDGKQHSYKSYWSSNRAVASKAGYKYLYYSDYKKLLKEAYNQINKGKPCIIYVTQKGGGQHYVTVYGYMNVKNPDDMTFVNLKLIDSIKRSGTHYFSGVETKKCMKSLKKYKSGKYALLVKE